MAGGTSMVTQEANPSLAMPESHMGTDSCLGYSTSDQVPCLWIEKASEMSQVLGTLHPCGRSRKKPLGPDFGSAQLHCVAIYKLNQQRAVRTLSLSLLSANTPFKLKKKNKFLRTKMAKDTNSSWEM